jgi:hypothetical protein
MRAVDTNVIVRLFARDDAAQVAAARQALAADTIFVPKTVVVIVDSIQRGDNPGWDGLLDLFPHYFHEPYYAEYANGSVAAWAEAAGLKPIDSERAFLSKVSAFTR